MKTINSISALALLSCAIGSAHAAAPSSELSVSGAIRTPACVISATDDGIYDYGLMSSSILPESGHIPLAEKTATVDVTCSAPTYIAFKPIDQRSGTESAVADGNMGLGSMTGRGGSQIGYYTVMMKNAKVDGVSRTIAAYDHGDEKVGQYLQTQIRPGTWAGTYSWSKRTTDTGYEYARDVLQEGQVFSMDFAVQPYLASRDKVGGGAPITEAVALDGSLLLVYSFGL